MSRGPGAVQRRLLAILENEDRLIDTIQLAALVFDIERNVAGQRLVSESRVASVRRALGKLAKAGKITDLGRHWHDGRRRWATPARAVQYHQRVNAVFGR